MLRLEFFSMGCQMLVAAEIESPQAEQRLNEVPGWFAEWEKALSRFRAESELNQLNQVAGSSVQVSPVIWDVMLEATNAWRESDGLVNPAILPDLERVGYVESFERIGAQPANRGENTAWIDQSILDIEMDHVTHSIRIPKSMRLDFGGVAKGWAAHQAMLRLKDISPVLVDAGGDIAISGPLPGGAPWLIGVNDPFHRGSQIATLEIREGGVATSGRDHRRWLQHGEMKHHIIDPRTGQPSKTDLLSVTVVAKTVMEAEMAAKVVLILGSQAGLDWIDKRTDAAGLAILENGELLGSHGIDAYLRS